LSTPQCGSEPDLYPEYQLVIHLDRPEPRLRALSDLHADIQDVFHEYGVQVMWPSFVAQPAESVFHKGSDPLLITMRGSWRRPRSVRWRVTAIPPDARIQGVCRARRLIREYSSTGTASPNASVIEPAITGPVGCDRA